MIKPLIAGSMIFFVLGCTNTVWVAKDVENDTADVEGIPFYVKREQHVQTTVYSHTWLNAELTVKKFAKAPSTSTDTAFETIKFQKQIRRERANVLDPVKQAIVGIQRTSEGNAQQIISQFLAIDEPSDPNSMDATMIQNTLKPEWVVDGRQKYYLNAPLPWFGTSNLTQEFGADGTLTKVISNPDTKLAEGLSTLIPFKEYLTGKYVDSQADKSDAELTANLASMETETGLPDIDAYLQNKRQTQITYVLSLETTEVGYLYTFRAVHSDPESVIAAIPFDVESGFYERTAIGAKKEEAKKDDKSQKVGISGEVKFPEKWGKSE